MSIDLEKVDLMGRINSLEILGKRYATRIRELEAALREIADGPHTICPCMDCSNMNGREIEICRAALCPPAQPPQSIKEGEQARAKSGDV